MSSEANVQLLKEAYRRWNDTKGGSVEFWFDSVIGPHISFGSVPRGAQPLAFATDYDDRAKLRGYFNGLLADWAMQHYTMEEYIAQGNVVIARGSTAWTCKKTGKAAETPKMDFWRFKDGKAVEYTSISTPIVWPRPPGEMSCNSVSLCLILLQGERHDRSQRTF